MTLRTLLMTLAIAGTAASAHAQSEGESEAATPVAESVSLDEALATSICNSEFGGQFASLGLWTVDGELVAVELRADIVNFSHPPSIYFALDGTQLGTIPMEPVTPGSPEALAYEAEISAYTQGGTLTETRSCSPYWEGEGAPGVTE